MEALGMPTVRIPGQGNTVTVVLLANRTHTFVVLDEFPNLIY